MNDAAPSNDKLTDIRQTLTYGHRTSLRWKWLALGLAAFVFGVGFAIVRPASFTAYDWFMTVLAIAVGGFMLLHQLYRLLVPGKPILVLSPEGIRIHFEWLKDIVIPWHEVHGVDTIDFTGSFRGTPVPFTDVTVVLVSQAFYDRRVHVGSWFLRGPSWHNHFIPKGSMVQVAFHHELLAASAPELRAAIEARWRALGTAATASAP